MSSEQAVARASAGPRAADIVDVDGAFRALLERGVGAAYRLAAVILGSAVEAEDATQDALERAWRSRASLRDAERFDAWFQRIVVNACRDRLRRRRSAGRVVPIERAGDALNLAARSDPFADSAQRDALRRALDDLNPDQRIAIAMRFYLDLEIDEIARRLGTRSGTVKSRLHRGLAALRANWENEL